MNESELIARYIAPLVTAPGADSLRDDVAILSQGGTLIATVDTLVEGVHFLENDPIQTIGRKLVRVNVSDILAKGALPLEALLSIAWPRVWAEPDFAALMQGIASDLDAFNISLVGGDTVGTEGPLTLSLTLTGRCIGDAPIRRSGGQPGDRLWVSGDVGWGHIGLEAALSGDDPVTAAKYYVPEIGDAALAQTIAGGAHASMDVSDGLLLDAHRLATASGCGARIALDKVPLARPVSDIAAMLAQCTGGDDYIALVAAPEGADVPGFTEIGRLVEGDGLELTHNGERVNLPVTLGFEH